jgi:hypothetical protein
MPISLGTRNRANIKWGPADVYIAEGATIDAPAAFGETITAANLATLLSSFTLLGKLEENPALATDPEVVTEIDSDDSDIIYERHHQSKISAEIGVAEVDNDIANAMITRMEAATKTDFLFIRTQAVGDYVLFIRNVPFSMQVIKNHTWEDIEKLIIRIAVKTTSLVKVIGQKKIT